MAGASSKGFFEIRLPDGWALKQALYQVLVVGMFLLTSRGWFAKFSASTNEDKFYIVMAVLITIYGALKFFFDPPYKAVVLSPEGIAFDMRWGKGIIGAAWDSVEVLSCKRERVVLLVKNQKVTVKRAKYNTEKWAFFLVRLHRYLGGSFELPRRSKQSKILRRVNHDGTLRPSLLVKWFKTMFWEKE